MLTSISPLGERARGHRWSVTILWYSAGSVLGGAVLGTVAAVAGVLAHLTSLGRPALAIMLLVGGIAGVTADTKLVGLVTPSPQRQVNERWLSRYRPWFYASAFGFQLGLGVVTQVYLVATYLMIGAALVSGGALAGLLIGMTFGASRAVAILRVARVRTFEALAAVAQRIAGRAGTARRIALLAEAALTVMLCTILWLS